VVHPDFLKPPPEDELPTVDQPPMVNPDVAGAGSVPAVIVATAEFWVVLIVPTTGVTVCHTEQRSRTLFRTSLIEGPGGFRDLGLNVRSASDIVLSPRKQPN